jgi:hypothetical protein
VKIWTDPSESYRHTGTYPSGNKYRIEVSNGSGIAIRDANIEIIGIAIRATDTGNSNTRGVLITTGSVGIKIDKCFIEGICSGTGTGYGIYAYASTATIHVTNTVVRGWNSGTDQHYAALYLYSGTPYIYNCTFTKSYRGISSYNAGTHTIKNCIFFNNIDDIYTSGATQVIDYCASDDLDGTNPVDISPGATEADDWAACFTDYANGDFSLKSTSVCIGAGVDDPGSGLYSDDILGNARTSPWDIGAFEYVAGGSSLTVNVPDAWSTLSDVSGEAPLLTAQLTFSLLTSDDLNGWSDLIEVDLAIAAATPLTVSILDDLNEWADSTNVRQYYYSILSETWELLDDSSAARLALLASFQDDLNLWEDSLSIDTSASYHLTLTDAWELLDDSLAARYTFAVSLQDDLNLWADTLDFSTNGGYSLTPTDSWGTLNDSLTLYLASLNLTLSFSDNLNSWEDSTLLALYHRVANTDTWELLEDSLDVDLLTPTVSLSVNLSDSLEGWADDFGFAFTASHSVGLVDSLTIPADGFDTFANLNLVLMDHRPTIEDNLFINTMREAMYSYETFAQLKAQLAARLHDTSKVFWPDAELTSILQETFRTFSLLTWHWREQGTFNTIPGTEMYDIATELSSRLGHTLTDRNLINDIQYHFQEDPTADWAAGWAGTAMFSMDDVAHCLQKRRNKFLADTGCYITRTVADSGGPIGGRITLADNIIDVRRVARNNSGVMTNLWRVNEEELTAFDTSWAAPAAQDPTEYSVMAAPPLTVQLSPAPLAAATLDMLTVSAGSDFTPTVSATVVGVPDDMAWIVKWGAMADLLLKDGPARDPERAKYCEERYQHGVALARLATPIVQARIGSLPLTVCALAELDAYSPGWQSHTAALPTTLATAGMNYIALDPPPNIGVAVYLDVVQNAPVPSDDADLVQIGREMVSTILDYAVHLAMFKVGGGEWQATTQLMEQFLLMCGNYNKRMEAASRLWKDMHSVTNYEEATRRRMKTAGEPRTPENWGYGKPGGK